MTTAYWVDRNGKIVKLREPTHILQIMDHPNKFGITKAYIEGVYKKHGEPLGSEGDAREEIILKVLESGFIRIRLYRQWWSVTVGKLNNFTKSILSKWAEFEQKNKQTGQYFPVKINITDKDKLIKVDTIGDVWRGVYEDEFVIDQDVIIEWVEINDFGFETSLYKSWQKIR